MTFPVARRVVRRSGSALAALLVLSAAACRQASVTTTAAPVPATTTPAVDLTKPPTLAPAPDVKLPPIVTRELPNGLRLMIVEHHELPVADFILLVRSGFEADPADHVGLASFTAAMLDEGAAGRNALEIADQQAFLGATISSGASWDYATVSLHTPTAQLDSALRLFADVALRPSFPTDDLERIRKERLTTLLQYRDRPTQIADLVYANVLFGANHPYGRPTIGTEASVRNISRADLVRFYEAHYRPNNATLIVVGDVRPDDVERRIGQLFGGWTRREVPRPVFSTAPTAGGTAVYLVDKPGAAQSSVRIGTVGVARSTEDFFPLMVMNTILGGAFSSRLNLNLREARGYTYGASSAFSMRQQPGPFTARSEIVAAKTDSALLEFMKELRGIREPVPAEELERTKQFVQLQLPAQFETTGGIASQLVPVAAYGLPLDYYNNFVRRIQAVTAADVQRVAQRYLDPARLTVVVVGDRKSIEPSIRALNLGQLSVRGIHGEPVSP